VFLKFHVPSALVLFLFCSSLALGQTSPDNQKPAKPSKGEMKNLDAIGNRNVGCQTGVGNWFSLDKQIQMGKAYSQDVESRSKLITDPMVTEYVNRIGQNLVRNSDAQVPFTIKVVDSDEVNAFALPGGFFYVDSGLILAADNEAELAGVMSHEIAHVAACHAARENTRGQLMNLASIPLIFVGGGIGYAVQEAAGLAFPMTFLKFSRGFESDADFLGLQYMYKAGYDPQAFTAFFEKIETMNKEKPGTLAKAFSTHPQTPDRIAKTQKEINTLLPPEAEYKLDTSEFEDVKVRLSQIQNRRKLDGGQQDGRPQLHRRANPGAGGTETADASGGEDRPTLKRRGAAASEPPATEPQGSEPQPSQTQASAPQPGAPQVGTPVAQGSEPQAAPPQASAPQAPPQQ
jgi:beta-barrel assembly-enhancing protease